jgi:heme-binding protein/cytochrome P460
MRLVWSLCIAGIVVIAILQFVRPDIPATAATAAVQVPADVGHILDKDCYSCHSDQRRLAWFDQIVPGYWLVRHDILEAREHLNFSTLGSKPAAAQRAALYQSVSFIQLGAMPLTRFLALHPSARVTPDELATLKTYLAPWASRPSGPTNHQGPNPGPLTPVSLANVRPELDGFPFDSAFEGWRPLSTTDRGDNNTLRFILGNDIAVKAARRGDITPWPDGTRFAKIAWQQEAGADGLIHPGAFVQVELMLKNATQYRQTDGWGWGRWRGLDLKPYGSDAHFANECTGCHMPVGKNDYVYTLPLSTAEVNREQVVNTRAATLSPGLPYQPLGWNAITMYVDPKSRTTATLYGNDAALSAVNTREPTPHAPAYGAGAILALVTWTQRDDPHWFGARIPDTPQSVEFVQVAAPADSGVYRRFVGAGLVEDHPSAHIVADRVRFIRELAPASLP